MTIIRTPPKCIFCGKAIAEPVYMKDPPFYGDAFIRWEYKKHTCPISKKSKLTKKAEKLYIEQKSR